MSLIIQPRKNKIKIKLDAFSILLILLTSVQGDQLTEGDCVCINNRFNQL